MQKSINYKTATFIILGLLMSIFFISIPQQSFAKTTTKVSSHKKVVVAKKATKKVAKSKTKSTTKKATKAPAKTATQGTYSLSDVATHNSSTNCWTTINGSVYNLTPWINRHPGGKQAIISLCGIDGTQAFNDQHGGQARPEQELKSFLVGKLK